MSVHLLPEQTLPHNHFGVTALPRFLLVQLISRLNRQRKTLFLSEEASGDRLRLGKVGQAVFMDLVNY